MVKNTEEIIQALQKISTAANQQVKDVLIAKFKHEFPNDLDWLGMFSGESEKAFGKYHTQLPEIKGYEILKKIGLGASGQVYLARDVIFKKKVAIKVPMVFLSQEQLHRFSHESLMLARLSHENIASIEKTGLIKKDNLPFIVMEYIDGKTIHHYCQQQQLNFNQIIKLFKQVLNAVQYAHNKGIVHRDIKPENILVNQEGQVKLLDFGIALVTHNSTQQLTQLTKTGEIVGTLAYMSPEQVSGNNDLDTRADIYSLGVVLYQLLSDSLPFEVDAGKIFAAISQIIEELPTKLTTQNHKVDANLATIVHHAMEKNPEARYQSPREFKNDLENWVNGKGISVKQQSSWSLLKQLAKKHKAIVTGTALAFAGLILGLIFAVSFALKEQKAREIAEISATTKKRALNFITNLFESADPENIFGEKLSVLQVIDNAESALDREVFEALEVELDIRETLASVYSAIQQFKKSEKQLNKIKNMLPQVEGDDERLDYEYTYNIISSRNNLLTRNAKQSIASLKALAPKLKNNPKMQYVTQRHLADSYVLIGELDLAAQIMQKLNEIPESKELPINASERWAGVLVNAKLLKEKGEFEKSEIEYNKLLNWYQNKYGKDHAFTQTVLNNLSVIYQKMGKLDKAQEILLQVIQRRKKLLGEFNINTFIARANLLSVQVKKGDFAIADKTSEELLNEVKLHLGELDSTTLEISNTRAYLLEDLGRLQEAEYIYRANLVSYQKNGTTKGASLIGLQNNLAMLLMKQLKYLEAQKLFKSLLDNVNETVGKEHIYYPIFIGNYGELLLKMNKYSEAKPLLLLSHARISKAFGKDHKRTLKAQKRLEQLAKHE